jgi:eukaryotic-like serine/threonine-protein kinase
MISTIGEGTRLGGERYILHERLGSGGAATVWLADDEVLERPVAVKVLSEALAADENWLARFQREARIAARLSHPNLVSVYDFDARDERPYIVMAHLPGGSLWDRMQSGERSDPEVLAIDILTALEAIHAAGIIHRDIKPGNVLFAADGTACLTDFGVARPEDATSLTQTGQIPGTAKFMAPELWRGDPADERTDLWATGVVLREAVGTDASASLLDLIDRLTADDPGDRPASASAALDELDGSEPDTPTVALAPTQPLAAPTEALPSPPRGVAAEPGGRSRRGPVIAGVAILAVVAIVAIALTLGGGNEPSGGSSEGSGNQSAANPEKAESSGSGSGSGSDSGSGSGSGGSAGGSGGDEVQASNPAPAVDPIALDQEGKALIDAGSPEEAIPILQQAVDYYPEDSRDINYAYSLYNLGDALLQAGRPEEAIPYLEKRLTWTDQQSTVQAKLDEARAATAE